MTGRARIVATFFLAVVFAVMVLGTASARTQAPSKYGGTLVVGISGLPNSLDPTLGRGTQPIEVYNTFCEQLYDYDSSSRIVPQLAAALPVISKDKLTYTIPLRQGIRFNDGTPFNAQAVVTTLQRDLTLPGSTRTGELSSIASITASGPLTVVIHLSTQFTPLTGVLALPDGVVLSPTQIAKLGADFATDPVCVGPFMFDHQVVGDNVTVIKSPYYYNQAAVHLDKIVFKPFPDTAAGTAALQAGDIQVLDPVSAAVALPGSQDAGLQLLHANGLGWRGIVINLANKNGVGNLPYTNIGTPLATSAKLRQAFEEAIDRTAMNKVVFGGTTQTGCTPMSPSSPTFDASIPCTRYSPSDARKLVAQSGFPNPTVHLLTSNVTEMVQLAQFIQAEEAAVGINVVIDSVDTATFASRSASGNFETTFSGPATGSSADQAIYDWVATAGSRNFAGYSSPRLDLILANTRKATSAKALRTLYHAAQQILLDDRPIIFLYHSVRYAGVSSDVTGVQLRPDLVLRVAFAQYK
jgi:peptide/nickel transport system substrate-binding protein